MQAAGTRLVEQRTGATATQKYQSRLRTYIQRKNEPPDTGHKSGKTDDLRIGQRDGTAS